MPGYDWFVPAFFEDMPRFSMTLLQHVLNIFLLIFYFCVCWICNHLGLSVEIRFILSNKARQRLKNWWPIFCFFLASICPWRRFHPSGRRTHARGSTATCSPWRWYQSRSTPTSGRGYSASTRRLERVTSHLLISPFSRFKIFVAVFTIHVLEFVAVSIQVDPLCLIQDALFDYYLTDTVVSPWRAPGQQ